MMADSRDTARSKSPGERRREQPKAPPPLPEPQRWDLNNALVWLLCGYILLIPIAQVVLHVTTPGAASNQVKLDRSVFVVISSITLSGFTTTTGVEGYTAFGKCIIIFLTLAGSIFSMMFGGLCVARIVKLRYSDRQIALGSVIACLALVLVGTLAMLSTRRSPLDSVMFAASAFGNSGTYFGRLPGIMSWQLHAVLLPLAVLGSLGLPVLMELFDSIRNCTRIPQYSWTMLKLTAVVYLAGVLVFTCVRLGSSEGSISDPDQFAKFFGANSVAAINSRTLGFPYAVHSAPGLVSYARNFPPMMLMVLIPFMMIGGCSAGTAGGLKISTIVELGRGVRRILKGENPGRSFGIAAAWVSGYLLLVLLFATALIGLIRNEPIDRILFETVSAMSNVGLSFDQIGHHWPSLGVFYLAMLAGRLAPLCVLWWMARTTRDAELPVG